MQEKLAVLTLAFFAAAGLANAQGNGKKGDAAPAAQTTVAQTDPNYIIGAQDTLNIDVWKEAELTKSVPVRPDGKISLPLLNDVQASGLTPQQLAAEITTGLKKYITDPQVTVTVSNIESQRIYILGEVNRAGQYPLLPQMNVMQALSSAGGFTPFAKQKKTYVMRTENGKQIKYPVDYNKVIKGEAPEQNILLKAGDTIVVP